MNLLDSLLDAIVRLEGDALVMHVGEKPYVVTTTSAMSEFRGPLLWGHVDLSSRVLTSEAVLGVLGQILPFDQRQALQELGAIEHEIDTPERNARFSIIAARAGHEVWVEVRRHPRPVAAAVEPPVVHDLVIAAEPPVAASEVAVQAPIASRAEPSIAEPVEEPVEEPLYLADTIEAVEQFAPTEVPVEASREAEPAATFHESASPIPVEQDETPDASFEIVDEVNQDAPTDADVDALLAESAATLLRTAPALDREPLNISHGAWQEVEEQAEPVAFEPEPDSVPVTFTDSAPVAEATERPVPEPMRLASETESIAIASELQHVARASAIEHVALTADIQADAEVTESLAPQPVASGPEPVLAGAEADDELIEFVEEFAKGEESPRATETTEFGLEPVATVPEFELALVGATAGFAPAAYADDFHLVAPTADAFPLSFEIEPEPERYPLSADVQPELFAFAEDALHDVVATKEMEAVVAGLEPVAVSAASASEPVAFVAATGTVLEASRAQPEPTHIIAEPAPVTVYSEPALVGRAAQSEHLHERRQTVATTYGSDRMTVSGPREPRVLASGPTHESQAPPESAVIVRMTQRLPVGAPRAEAGSANAAGVPAGAPKGEADGAKAGSVRDDTMASTPANLPPEFSLDELLRLAAARGASTVYLVARSRPMVRADGDISVLDIGAGTLLEESDIARLLASAPEAARDAWHRGASAEWICEVAGAGRVRCMTFRDHRGPGLIFRMIPPQAISADQLGFTPEVQALCTETDGLVVVTGPRVNGTSTLMSGFVDLINRTRSDHVITIESQIDFVHESRRSFVSQREVRGDDETVVSAIRSALREDPDVLFIGELSSAEVATMALDAVDSGRLVFASLPAPSTVPAVDRLLELLPADRPQARASIAASLRGVVAEVLVGRMRGGRVAAREVLLNTVAVAGLIQDGKTDQLPLAMENGRRHGMMPLNDTLAALVRDGTVHVSEAYRKAFDKESLLAALRQEGVDTSFAEKIA